jgi:starvation-inducible outer membrane lipoprotein
MKKRFIRLGGYTINIEQIAFVEHREDRIELVFTALSGGARPIIGLKGTEATALSHALENY